MKSSTAPPYLTCIILQRNSFLTGLPHNSQIHAKMKLRQHFLFDYHYHLLLICILIYICITPNHLFAICYG